MGWTQYLPDRLRSRYAVKLLGLSVLVVAVILATGSVMAFQVSHRVTDEQLRSIEANAELEATALGRWLAGEQGNVRVLSEHEGIDPGDPAATRATLRTERDRGGEELAALHLVERASVPTSNGTTETILVSTDRELEGRALAATNIEWGENPDGTERTFGFENRSDLLVSWVYMDGDEPSVVIASPTPDGEYVLEHTSGLGLWFAHWTVEASGGDISYHVSGETTVSVALPLAETG